MSIAERKKQAPKPTYIYLWGLLIWIGVSGFKRPFWQTSLKEGQMYQFIGAGIVEKEQELYFQATLLWFYILITHNRFKKK